MLFSDRSTRLTRLIGLFLASIAICLFTVLAIQPGTAQETAALSTSTKSVDKSTAERGDTLRYTLVISNTGSTIASNILVTDTLPSAISYVSGTLSTPAGIGILIDGSGISGNVITWTGSIQVDSAATIRYDAIVSDTAPIDAFITNTMQIGLDGSIITRTASTEIISQTLALMPMISEPYGQPVAEGSNATFDSNIYSWSVTWSAAGADTSTFYRLEESTSGDFSTITNSYTLTGNRQNFSRGASEVANTYFYRVRVFSGLGSEFSETLPVIIVPDPPTVSSSRVTGLGDREYQWTVSWTNEIPLTGVEYVIEESTDSTFGSNVTSMTTSDSSASFQHSASTTPTYYYRVRLASPSTAPWSDVHTVYSAYWDEFTSNVGWEIRRQDFDDVENVLDVDDGELLLDVRSRFDYFITSSLVAAPDPPYRITTRVKFDNPRFRHTYGVVFGGDWNGGVCPSKFADSLTLDSGDDLNEISALSDALFDGSATRAVTDVEDNCLNHYYRHVLLWLNGGGEMNSQFKKINFHDDENIGRGDGLGNDTSLDVSSTSSNDWNEWTWEVYPDGRIKVYAGDNLELEVQDEDASYVNDRYWGFFASTDERTGSDPRFDWVLVEPFEE